MELFRQSFSTRLDGGYLRFGSRGEQVIHMAYYSQDQQTVSGGSKIGRLSVIEICRSQSVKDISGVL